MSTDASADDDTDKVGARSAPGGAGSCGRVKRTTDLGDPLVAAVSAQRAAVEYLLLVALREPVDGTATRNDEDRDDRDDRLGASEREH